MLRAAAVVVLVATLGTFLMYGNTLGFGFHYDDYHFIRPYSGEEVRAAFHGPWDPAGIEVPFYRPLTVALYAARFELFGIDSRAHHAASLALFAVAAILLGGFTALVSRRADAAALATLFFVIHPGMPYAMVAWVTNQMHLAATIVVSLGLAWWAWAARRGWAWWMPLLGFGAAAFLIKEDGIMLLPTIVVLHWLRRRAVEPALPPAPRIFVAAAAVVTVGLVLLRADALEGLGGYARPTAERAWHNYLLGLNRVFRLVPPDRPWQPFASWFATLLPIAALVLWRRTSPAVRYTLLAGAAMAALFDLPFIFVTKNEQMHLVTAGAVLVLAASSVAVYGAFRVPAWRMAMAALITCGAASFAVVAKDVCRDFEPFGPIVLATDDIVREWAPVPEELREFLRRKREPGAAASLSANPAESIEVVAFGLHATERSPEGVLYRWMAQPSIELHVAAHVSRLDIPVRHEVGAFREPAHLRVETDGRAADALVLDHGSWRVSRLTMPARIRSWTRRAHRVRLTIPRIWRPSEVIPGSIDARPLGLQIGEIRAR